MSTWQDEYERRLRRVVGVTDDSVAVSVDTEIEYMGGCETCAWEQTVIVVTAGRNTRQFTDLGDLMREVDGVDSDVE